MSSHIDSNCNHITTQMTDRTIDGRPLVVVRLVDDPERGYIALDEGTGGGFGDESCPSSYGMACMTWFGVGERYPTPEAALAAIADSE
jgi:hypothetical protein